MKVICYSCGRGEYPENTLEGIRHCQTVNADWRIEMDVQMTSDGHLVLFHDYHMQRTTGIDKKIHETKLADVKRLNAGFNFEREGEEDVGSHLERYVFRENPVRIPELALVFEAVPDAKLLLDIHTSDPKVVKVFIDLIDSNFALGDFIIASEYDHIIRELRKRKPNWRYAVPTKEAKRMLYSSFLGLDALFPIRSDILMLPKQYGKINVLRPSVIRHAQKRGKEIWAWMYEGEKVTTVTTYEEMAQLKELGVSGIFTAFPEKFNAILKARALHDR